MKYATLSAAAVTVLASLASAAPHGKRAPICDLSQLEGLTITATGDPNGKIRWNEFVDPNFGIPSGAVAWYQENQPDGPARFRAIGSTNGPDIFSFQRGYDLSEITISGSGLHGAASGGAEFIVTCNNGCKTDVEDNQLVANGCTMEATDGNDHGTHKCVHWSGEGIVPVDLVDCDGSVSQQVGIFTAFF